jgi:hypothetical protein
VPVDVHGQRDQRSARQNQLDEQVRAEAPQAVQEPWPGVQTPLLVLLKFLRASAEHLLLSL